MGPTLLVEPIGARVIREVREEVRPIHAVGDRSRKAGLLIRALFAAKNH